LQFPPEAWLRLSLHHASITWISVMPSGRVILRTLGDTGHMPPEAITSSWSFSQWNIFLRDLRLVKAQHQCVVKRV